MVSSTGYSESLRQAEKLKRMIQRIDREIAVLEKDVIDMKEDIKTFQMGINRLAAVQETEKVRAQKEKNAALMKRCHGLLEAFEEQKKAMRDLRQRCEDEVVDNIQADAELAAIMYRFAERRKGQPKE